MPALDLRIIEGIGKVSVILQRDTVPTHEIVEAFAVSKFSLPLLPGPFILQFLRLTIK
jgi:hypothetical protein